MNDSFTTYMILDNPNRLLQTDRSQMIEILKGFPNQIGHACRLVKEQKLPKMYNIQQIIVTGMGGSAISGDLLKSYAQTRFSLPIFVNRSYHLPKWVNKHTLVLAQSYSGNTEETLSAFKIASEKKAAIIGISSGGKLESYCQKRSIPHLKIPAGFPPRTALAYLFFGSLLSLQEIGIWQHRFDTAINESIEVTKQQIAHLDIHTPTPENQAKTIAQQLHETIPQIYGWDLYQPIARRWTTQINENAKTISTYASVPESNHNDIVGWAGDQKHTKQFSCILFRDKQKETLQLSTRFNFMKKLFSTAAAHTIEVPVQGKKDLTKMMYLLQLGDFISYYLAQLREIDPTPVMIIDQLKQELDQI